MTPFYYLAYARRMVAAVRRLHGHCLDAEDTAYLAAFDQLSHGAQALLVRLISRKGRVFRLHKLCYGELPDCAWLAGLLEVHGWLSPVAELPVEERLAVFSKDEIAAVSGIPKARALSRAVLLSRLQEEAKIADVAAVLESKTPVIALANKERWQWLLFLFFGETGEDLTRFVLRDLQEQAHGEREAKTRFATAAEARAAFAMARLYEEFRVQREALPPVELHAWVLAQTRPEITYRQAAAQWGHMLLRTGQILERAKCYAEALQLYAGGQEHPARERLARCYKKLGDTEAAIAVCEAILAHPWHDEERLFAEDMLRSLQQRKSLRKRTTARQRCGTELVLAKRPVQLESEVLAALEAEGWRGVHSENWLWNRLFFDLYEPVIGDASVGRFSHELQRLPDDFGSDEFYPRRQGLFAEQSRMLCRPARLRSWITGRFGPLVDDALGLIGKSPKTLNAIRAVTLDMAEKPSSRLRGFPDLMLWHPERGVRFREVKSPNDQLSYMQLYWLDRFAHHGLDADVLNVRW